MAKSLVEHPALGVELHHKSTPKGEEDLPFAVCYQEHPGVWYVVRRAYSDMSGYRMIAALRRYTGRRLCQFYVWEVGTEWRPKE
jgi:hypothetical protein